MYITLKKGLPVLVGANPGTILNECSIDFPIDPVTKQCIAGATARIQITTSSGEKNSEFVPFAITE